MTGAEGMALPAFVESFRNDLVYAAPETWPDKVTWFFGQLVDRYGAAPDGRRGLFDTPLHVQLGPIAYEHAIELCGGARDADMADDRARASKHLAALAALLAPSVPARPTTPTTKNGAP